MAHKRLSKIPTKVSITLAKSPINKKTSQLIKNLFPILSQKISSKPKKTLKSKKTEKTIGWSLLFLFFQDSAILHFMLNLDLFTLFTLFIFTFYLCGFYSVFQFFIYFEASNFLGIRRRVKPNNNNIKPTIKKWGKRYFLG